MRGANNPRIGCNTQGIYIMMHGIVKMTSRSKISNKCAIKWSKMNNKSHGASNTSSMIRNIHAQERCHLEGVSLCILHNAEVVEKVLEKLVVIECMRLALKSSNGQLT